MDQPKKRVFFASSIWFLLLLAAFYLITDYSLKSESKNPDIQKWPKESTLSMSQNKYTLITAIHPKCACSFATINELNRLLVTLHSDLSLLFLIYTPTGEEEWKESPLVKKLQALPSSQLVIDLDGKEAAKFELSVSGECQLFSPEGSLLFSGGITASRAHEGDALGQTMIKTAIVKATTEVNTTPAFGCPIKNEEVN